MKSYLLFCLFLLSVESIGQKLAKPGKNKSSGSRRTELTLLTTSKWTFGGGNLSLSFVIGKRDTGSFYLDLIAQSGTSLLRTRKGDPVAFTFTDSTVLDIPAEKDGEFTSSRDENRMWHYSIYSSYNIDSTAMKLLAEKELFNVKIRGIRGKDPWSIRYKVDPKKKDLIIKSLALFKD